MLGLRLVPRSECFRLWPCGGATRGGTDRSISTSRSLAHRLEALGVGHQCRGLAVAQRAARGKRQGNGRSRNVVRHLGDKHRSEEHTSELQSHSDLVCRLLLEKKKKNIKQHK